MVIINPQFADLIELAHARDVRAVVLGENIGVAKSLEHIHDEIFTALKRWGATIAEPHYEVIISNYHGEPRVSVTSYPHDPEWRKNLTGKPAEVITDLVSLLSQEP